MAFLYNYKGEVTRIIDGDTVRIRVDLGFRMSFEDNFRLYGIDTPEIRGRERPEGLIAKAFVVDIMPPGTHVEVHTSKSGKYGRWLAEIFAEVEGEIVSVNQLLLDKGLAELYL